MCQVTVRQYQKGDEQQIIELLDLVFDGWPSLDINCTPLEHWEWKFKDNPNGSQNIVVCTDESKIVGCLQDFPLSVKVLDKEVKCGNALDAAVHPDYRKRGIYGKMMKLINEERTLNDTYIVNAITGNPILMATSTGPVFPSSLQTLVRIRDIDLHFKMRGTEAAIIKKIGYKGLKSLNKIKTKLSIKNKLPGNVEIIDITKFDLNINDFWSKVKNVYKYSLVRNMELLNWRFCDPRAGKYKIRITIRDDQVMGYCVTRINNKIKEYPVGYIVDLMTLPGQENIAQSLISDALTYFDDENVNIVLAFCIVGSRFESFLKAEGLLNSRSRVRVSLRPLGPASEDDIKVLHDCKKNQLDYQYVYADWI